MLVFATTIVATAVSAIFLAAAAILTIVTFVLVIKRGSNAEIYAAHKAAMAEYEHKTEAYEKELEEYRVALEEYKAAKKN